MRLTLDAIDFVAIAIAQIQPAGFSRTTNTLRPLRVFLPRHPSKYCLFMLRISNVRKHVRQVHVGTRPPRSNRYCTVYKGLFALFIDLLPFYALNKQRNIAFLLTCQRQISSQSDFISQRFHRESRDLICRAVGLLPP